MVNFAGRAGYDNQRYQKFVYHYYYILNVKEFYKDFENVKIEITYPKEYLLKANFEGTITETGDKKILTITPGKDFHNLSFSYMKSRISKLGIFLYRAFPFLYNSYFIAFLIVFLFFVALAWIIIYFLVKAARTRGGKI